MLYYSDRTEGVRNAELQNFIPPTCGEDANGGARTLGNAVAAHPRDGWMMQYSLHVSVGGAATPRRPRQPLRQIVMRMPCRLPVPALSHAMSRSSVTYSRFGVNELS